ncbi:hypothetical protein C5748_16235 [Phyllobacterium phragmitis]|uniref:GcrA cell cycle regulator n=1 Tax=Phyllobacterium phragmitis TaxID=2670329 RepID=A0A2S9IP97_9HYPH|nr:GcrA family cell cycle regulator [Phyllobacterium phragmitis]PRD42343.1 hypothetical protein C5748_16235 [Phyllobacterium phragmitis]
MASLWTPQVMAELQRYWRRGDSAAQIASLLSISRSAVLGKVHRHPDIFASRPTGSPSRKQKGAQSSLRAPGAVRPEAPTEPVANAGAVVPEITDARDIIVVPMSFERALQENRCLFFAADPFSAAGPLMPVCGCERAENPKRKPYCAAHLRTERRPRT